MAGVAVPPPPPPPPPPPAPLLLASSGSSSQFLNVAAANQSGPGAVSGPAMSDGNAVKSWDRPWGPRELRENAAKWSLAGDSGLLLYLRDFSQRMLQRTHEMEKQVDDLVSDVKTSSVKAHNIFNEFAVLANTQFVENRVYEEDINAENQPAKTEEKREKTREEVEAELVPKVMQAVRLGIEVLEKSFVKLDSHVTGDSEDEDEPYQGDALYEPKDPYVSRPLPYLIGSTKFDESDDIGLRERPPEETASDHGSLSESDEEEPSVSLGAAPPGAVRKPSASELSTSYSESDSDADEEDRPTTAKPAVPKMVPPRKETSESEESGDLFKDDRSDQSDEEADVKAVPKQQPAPALDFTRELQKKFDFPRSKRRESSSSEDSSTSDRGALKQAPGKAGTAHPQNIESRQGMPKPSADQKKSRIPEGDSEDDPFKPADDDEEDDWIGGKKSLFSAPAAKSSLFSPSSDLFDTPPEQPATRTAAALPKAAVPPTTSAPSSSAGSAAAVSAVRKSKPPTDDLFREGSDDDDDDLFLSSAAASTKPKAAADGSGPARTSAQPSASKSAGEAAAKPSWVKAKSGLFDDEDDDDDDLFATINSTIIKKATVPVVPPSSELAAERDSRLAETTEADATDKTTLQKSAKKFPAGAVPIFGNQPNPFAALRAARPPTQSDEDDEHEKSTEVPPPRPSATRAPSFKSSEPAIHKPAAAPAAAKPPAAAAGGGLFDDDGNDSDDDLFSALSSHKKKETTKKASTLVLDPDDVPAKADVKATPEPTVRPVRADSSRPAVLSLFGEGDDGEGADNGDDLFFSPAPKLISKSSKAEGTSRVIGTQPETTDKTKPSAPPQGDPFGASTVKPSPQAIGSTGEPNRSSKDSPSAPAQQRNSKTETSRQRVDLFDSDEEEDLFAPKPSIQTAAKPSQPRAAPSASVIVTAAAVADSDPLFGSTGAIAAGTADSRSSAKPAAASKPDLSSILTASDDGDDDSDLFSHPKISDKSTVASRQTGDVSAPSFKKPAGAVPVLRGIDTSAVTKSKAISAAVVDPLADVSQQLPAAAESRDDTRTARTAVLSPAEEPFKTPTAIAEPFASKSDPEELGRADGSSNDGDLFSSAVAAKPKKPAGAVSMFGGSLDPSSIFLKKGDRPSGKDLPETHSSSTEAGTQANDRRPETEVGSTNEVQDTFAPRLGKMSATTVASAQTLPTKRSAFPADDDDENIFSSADTAEHSSRTVPGQGAALTAAKAAPPGAKAAAFVSQASATTSGGLFGSPDDDDSGGLFGIIPKQSDPTTTSSVKPRSGSAAASKAQTEQPLAASTQTETAQPSKGTGAATSDQPKIRGMFDEDDDDLFSPKKSSTEPSAAVPKTSLGQPSRKPPPAEVSIFGDLGSPAQLGNKSSVLKSARSPDEIDDELFGASDNVEPQATKLKLPVADMLSSPAKKPPPGGIPMFGGAAALPRLLSERAASANVPDDGADAATAAILVTASAAAADKSEAASRRETTAVASDGDKHRALDDDVFSYAASADGILANANKGRARVQQKRRPQSRQARLLAAAQSTDSMTVAADEEPATTALPVTAAPLGPSGLPANEALAKGRHATGKGLLPTGITPAALAGSSMFKKAKSGWDPDATDESEDLFSSEVVKGASLASPAGLSASKETGRTGSSRADIADTAASATSAGRTKLRDLFGNDDLLGSDANDVHNTFEPSWSAAAPADNRASVAAVETGSAAVAVASASIPALVGSSDTRQTGAGNVSTIAVEPSGELFSPAGSKAVSSGSAAAVVAAAAHDDLFGNQAAAPAGKAASVLSTYSDDDDIFADASILKKDSTHKVAEPAVPSAEPASKLEDIMPASDIKKNSKKTVKPVTKVEDMFADDTDIFADLPSLPKAATTKTKKQGQSSSKKKSEPSGSIFGEQEDDIFAPSSKTKASKAREKPKEKNSSTTVTSAKKTTEDFVDPLAADGGQ